MLILTKKDINKMIAIAMHVQLPLAVSIITTAHEIGHNHGSPVSYSFPSPILWLFNFALTCTSWGMGVSH